MQFTENEVLETIEEFRAETESITGCSIGNEVLARHMKAVYSSVARINDPDAQAYACRLAACLAHLVDADHLVLHPDDKM